MGWFQKSLDFEASLESLVILSYEQQILLHSMKKQSSNFMPPWVDKFV